VLPSTLLPPAGTLAGNHTSRLPLRQIRRDRRRVRTTDNHGSVRLPSVRPELCSPGGLGPACCSRAQPRPAPCRLPRSLPASSKAGGPFQTIPGSRRGLAASPFTSGKMRLSDFCNRLYKTSTLRTVRFPVALLVHPTCVGASLAFASIECRHVLGLGPHGSGGWEPRIRLPDEPPSGASLDGESPASASAATLTCASEDEPRGAMVIRPRAVLVELRSLLLCAGPPDPGVFSLEPSMRRSL